MNNQTFTHAPMNAIDALSWCREHRGTIRFEADGSVSVEAHGTAVRATVVGDATTALRAALVARGVLA